MIVLFYLEWNDSALVLGNDIDQITNYVVRSAITEMGFVFDSDKFRYEGIVTLNLVHDIVQFFRDYGENLQLDKKCSEYYDMSVQKQQNFELLRLEGTRIRNESHATQITIPRMKDSICLQQYQIMPVMHAYTLGNTANFSVPGSGKTWMAYSTFFLLKHKPHAEEDRVDKLLVIGPISSFVPWETEYEEITGKKPNLQRISGSISERSKIFSGLQERSDQPEIFLVSYATAAKEKDAIMRMLGNHKFMVIVDESHHIKNPQATQTCAIMEISRVAHKRMILTGTMMPNNILDLWSQFTFLYPGRQLLGSLDQFTFDSQESNSHDEIRHKLMPFFTRVSKSKLNLRPPEIARIPVKMKAIQQKIYNTIAGHIARNDPNYDANDFIAMRMWRRRSIVYLLEAATDPSLLIKNTQFTEDLISGEGLPIQDLLDRYQEFEVPSKLEAAGKLAIENLMRGNKIIMWCSFIGTIKKMENMLGEFNPLTIYGAIPKDDTQDTIDNREKRINAFKTDNEHNLLIANPASLAESVSLHKACHHAIYVDRTFNGGHYMQSLERIHRIGLDPEVKTKYTIFQSENSIDFGVDNRLEIKKDRMDKFLNDEVLGTMNLDLHYNDPIGSDDDLDADYRVVLDHLKKIS